MLSPQAQVTGANQDQQEARKKLNLGLCRGDRHPPVHEQNSKAL